LLQYFLTALLENDVSLQKVSCKYERTTRDAGRERSISSEQAPVSAQNPVNTR
jgi:hypothetical protein